MRRIVPAVFLVIVLVIGGGILVNTAYQAGLSTAVATAAANGGTTVVAPAYGWGYGMGYGWHPFGFGFGIFGLLFGLFFLFLVFGLIRAIFWGGRRGWGPGGWGGPSGWYGPGGRGPGGHGPGGYADRSRDERNPWIDRFGPSFEEWHRHAHEAGASSEPPASNTTSKPA